MASRQDEIDAYKLAREFILYVGDAELKNMTKATYLRLQLLGDVVAPERRL